MCKNVGTLVILLLWSSVTNSHWVIWKQKVFKAAKCKLLFSLTHLWRTATWGPQINSTDLKTKIVHLYGLGEGYKKQSQRFQLSVSTVRKTVREWKAAGRCCSDQKWQAKKNREAKTKDDQPTDPLQRPARSGCRWCHCASLNNTAQFAQGKAAWESERGDFLPRRHKPSRFRYAKAHLDKPASFWNKVQWTSKTKM